MISVLFDDVVYTDYGQFTIVSVAGGFDGDADRFFARQVNGWVGTGVPGTVYVSFGRRSGGSRVRIEHLEREPEVGPWEDIVEASVRFPVGSDVSWESWAGDSSGPLAIPPGSYRVRVGATGRDAGHADEFADGVVDSYLIQFWPAPEAGDEILRTTSADADYWNSEWGGRRT